LNNLQILPSEVGSILEEHLEASLLLIWLVGVDEAGSAAVVRARGVEAKSFLTWVASVILHHFSFIYDT
tara:strand:- start:652 stop:858 length:207 start_codon:yes stop_codon:yes gene_type:complete